MMKLDCFYASGYILKTQGTSTNVRYDVNGMYVYDIGIGLWILQKSCQLD